MRLLSAVSIRAWLALITVTEAVIIKMHQFQNCQGQYSQCTRIQEGQCCTNRPFETSHNPTNDRLPAASSRFDDLPPTAIGLTFQSAGYCNSEPVSIGFGVTFCLNSVPSVYEQNRDRLITGARWEVPTKKCDTSVEACAGWNVNTGLKNGLDMGDMQRIGTIPMNLFSRDNQDEADKGGKGCQVADGLTFANGHRFKIHPDTMGDEDYALLMEHADADSNIEDIPKHLHKYEIQHEGVLARRQVSRRGLDDSAERLAKHYAGEA